MIAIRDIRLNGLKEFTGHNSDEMILSWKGSGDQPVKLIVTERNTGSPVFEKNNADSFGTLLDFEAQPKTVYDVLLKTEGTSETFTFETGRRDAPWTAEWISTQPEDHFHPVFVKQFLLESLPEAARLYISAAGLFEAYLNGTKISDQLLTPYFNDYMAYRQCITFDVSGLLQKDNTLEVYCGKGWFMSRYGSERAGENNYGDRYELTAALEADGSVIVSSDRSWQYRKSFILDDGIYDGEVQDRRVTSDLKPVSVIEVTVPLKDCTSVPVTSKNFLEVQEVIHTPAGETVLDFGQNHAGWVEFIDESPAGTEIHLEFGEVLQNGNFYNANYRSALNGFRYISDGKTRTVRPHFTYYGCRYVKVSGIEQVEAGRFRSRLLYADMTETGFFSCGNEKINRLYGNTKRGLYSNFLVMPTDCPQRDERTGWTADAQVFARTACFHVDTRAFYDKFLADVYEEQQKFDGAVPNYIPTFDQDVGSCAIWGDAAVIMPMTMYEYYGDLHRLKQQYPSMCGWVRYLDRTDAKRGHTYLYDWSFQFGDWLAQDGITPQSYKGSTDDTYLASVYWFHSAELCAKAAELLGKEADAKEFRALAENIKAAVLREYFSESGRLAIDTQTAYIIALRFGLYKDKDKLIASLKDRFRRDGYVLKCGFSGAPLMCQVLADNDMGELAAHFLFNESFPGWLYEVNLGATTIWERWNSMLEDGTCSGTAMNSFNHYSYGSVSEYLYSNIAGLKALEPGFKKALIKPYIDARLSPVSMSYDSQAGKYEIHWEIDDNGALKLTASVPDGAEALVVLPDGSEYTMLGGVHTFVINDRDYRTLYSDETLLTDLVKDIRVKDIFESELPQASFLYETAKVNAEMGGLKLKDLGTQFYLGLNPENTKPFIAKVKELRLQEETE